jgi:hypothetical protein
MCFNFPNKGLSEKYIILRRNKRDIIVHVHRSSYQTSFSYLIFMKLDFLERFFEKNTKTLNFTKISPVAAELFHADRQTLRS